MSNRLHEVDAYLENLEPLRRVALTELRSLVLAEVPDAVATMKYRMPTFELDGRVLLICLTEILYELVHGYHSCGEA